MLLALILALPSIACEPPWFYRSLPRDRTHYYGVARDPDTEKARDQAVRNLGKQVTGDVESWDSKKLKDLAGPCRDKYEVAKKAGTLLPNSTLLAGWEQDDFERCDGQSYVMVRIEKERVEKFMLDDLGFKKSLVSSLEKRISDIEARLDRIEKALGGKAQDIRLAIARGAPKAQLDEKMAAMEKRLKIYQAARDTHETERLAALKKEKLPELDAIKAKVESGKWTALEVMPSIMLYRDLQDQQGFRDFARSLLNRKDSDKLGEHKALFAYLVIAASSQLKDYDAVLKESEEFLRDYPKSDLFPTVKSMIDSTLLLQKLQAAQAPAAGQEVAAADACP